MLVTKLALACFAAASLAERPPGYTGNEQTTTESFLLGSFTKGVGGSIVAADACETIYALTCTEASNCDTGVTASRPKLATSTEHISNFLCRSQQQLHHQPTDSTTHPTSPPMASNKHLKQRPFPRIVLSMALSTPRQRSAISTRASHAVRPRVAG